MVLDGFRRGYREPENSGERTKLAALLAASESYRGRKCGHSTNAIVCASYPKNTFRTAGSVEIAQSYLHRKNSQVKFRVRDLTLFLGKPNKAWPPQMKWPVSYGSHATAYREVNNYVSERVRHFLQRRHKVQSRATIRFGDERVFGELRVIRLGSPPRIA
jgi:hypothetical protein